MKNIYNYILNLFFPKKCINCQREGSYLCEDCLSLIELNQITYCACIKNPLKNKIICDNCPKLVSAVFTIFNEKQYICQKLFLKSKTIPDLNAYFSYLIITHLKNITNINLDNNFAIYFENEDIKNIAKSLSKFTKIPIKNNSKNILFITKKYPSDDIFKIIKTLNAKEIYVISLFRQIS